MKASKVEFPNPVLAYGRDDYSESCSFGTTIEPDHIGVDTENIVVPISYSLVSKNLQTLLDEGKAAVVVTVRSGAASYSQLFEFPAGATEGKIEIPKFDVVRRIEITGSVVAAEPIARFEGDGEFDELYFGSSTFDIRKGDTLASEDTKIVNVDDTELEKPLASIFDITKAPDQQEDIVLDFEDEKIHIYLKPELFALYNDFKDFNNGALRRYINSVIVLPALVEAIDKILQYHDDYGMGDGFGDMAEHRWFRSIELKAEKLGVDMEEYQDSAVTLADRLLNGIAFDALRSFKDTLDSELDSGETQTIGGVD